ncbi:plastocyanin/azurin family copper-binding protein [Paractinoplanes maris]|uniref:plastocyanin/azurin family copper-binding protein n=1 Tax=Paractinoplanes maris TaxID=1734446 RepID=UPI00202168BC|nr:plastocyanin/azurin family copper-binding protein [Actinoplanes maris]
MKLSLSGPRSFGVAALLVAAAAGCGSGSGTPSGGAQPATGPSPATSADWADSANSVDIHNFAFDPAALTVKSGAAVTWTFADSTDHTVVADDNSFSSQPMGDGETFSHTFGAAGPQAYHCSIHPFMKAAITVE